MTNEKTTVFFDSNKQTNTILMKLHVAPMPVYDRYSKRLIQRRNVLLIAYMKNLCIFLCFARINLTFVPVTRPIFQNISKTLAGVRAECRPNFLPSIVCQRQNYNLANLISVQCWFP